MSRKADLEHHIHESYDLVREYEAIIQTSSDPKVIARSRRAIEEQWALIEGYLAEHCRLAGGTFPADIAEIAAHFPEYASPRRAPPPLTSVLTLRTGSPLAIVYATFEIVIGPRTEVGYPVRVHPTETVPAARGTLDLDPMAEPVRRLAQEIEDEDPRGRRKALLAEFGGLLFECLFTKEIAASFHKSWGHARAAGQGLRLRLDVEPPDLAALPWEYLHHAAEDHFFAIAADTPLTRFVSDLRQPLEPLAVEGQLRMLLVTASPQDAVPLDLAAGQQNIAQALADVPGVELLSPLEHATPFAVREALRRHRPHIVHFLGHGYFQQTDAEEQAGVVLEDDSGRACRLAADEFARLFQAAPGAGEVKLLVLNACEGAKASSARPLVGVAHNVLRHVPAVVAMQYPVYDDVARGFAREFYRALAAGHPVDAAVSEARNALYIDYGSDRRDWGIPVLFLRSEDGRLFASQPTETRPSGDADGIRSPAAPALAISQRRQLEQRRDELQGPLATYNRRIKALQSDLARELDGERRAVLEERLDEARHARDKIQTELEDIERQLGGG